MNRMLARVILCLLLFMPLRAAHALMVTVSQQDLEEALREGREKGDQIAEHVSKKYRFGEDDVFGENGMVRTKVSKIMVLSGLLAAKDRKPSDEELKSILASTELQIDLHTFGARMDFANTYTAYLIQSGKRIDPEKVAIDDVAYFQREGFATSGFPRYRATIRSYFFYDKINPVDKAEIVLVKDKKKVSFEVDFARYK